MSLSGTGAVLIWHDLAPEALDDFYQWHNREHMPERVAIPGFRQGRRYIAIEGRPQFFNLYEADTPAVLGGSAYLERLNHPTAWTRRVVPSFCNVARAICAVAFSEGVGCGGIMLTARFDVVAGTSRDDLAACAAKPLLNVSRRTGVTGVHLCVADDAISRIETAEKKSRADATAVPAAALLIEGIGAAEVRLAFDAAWPALAEWASGTPGVAVYRLEFMRLKTPSSAG